MNDINGNPDGTMYVGDNTYGAPEHGLPTAIQYSKEVGDESMLYVSVVQVDELKTQNNKLCELVSDMLEYLSWEKLCGGISYLNIVKFENRAQALGVESDCEADDEVDE